MQKKRYSYVGSANEFNGFGCKFKSFSSFKKMREFAQDESHDGTYYVTAPDITFKYTREQISNWR